METVAPPETVVAPPAVVVAPPAVVVAPPETVVAPPEVEGNSELELVVALVSLVPPELS